MMMMMLLYNVSILYSYAHAKPYEVVMLCTSQHKLAQPFGIVIADTATIVHARILNADDGIKHCGAAEPFTQMLAHL